MASSLYRTRPVHIPVPKLYGYKIIDQHAQSELIERLSRPTISILQAQIHAAWQSVNQFHGKSLPLKKTVKNRVLPTQPDRPAVPTVGKLAKSNGKQLTIKMAGEDFLNSKLCALSVDTKSTDTHESSAKPMDLLQITDYHLVDTERNNINLQWPKEMHISPLHPPCTCPRGVALFRAEMDRWRETHVCVHSMTRPSTPRSTCTHFLTPDPIEWKTVRRIVRRLNDSQTIASAIRRKENSRCKRRSPVDPRTAPLKGVGYKQASQNGSSVKSPRTRSSLFDKSGQFKTQIYVGRFQQEHRLEQDLKRLSRPTTASSFKQRGSCPICDHSPGERTILGVEYAGFARREANRPGDRKEEIRLIKRISRPTCSISADHICCKHSREWTKTPTISWNEGSRTYISGEEIVQRIAQSQKYLPLLSGLPRSSSVNSITKRLSSGKCSRATWQSPTKLID